MESIISMGRFKLRTGLEVFKKRKIESLDFSRLETSNAELKTRVEKLKATLNGDDQFFLCLTKRKEVCDDNSHGG